MRHRLSGVTLDAASTARLPRRIVRPVRRGWIGGVCLGVAEHLNVPPLVVRLAFVVAAGWRLVGVPVYFLLWLVLPRATELRSAPGLEAASRTGMRTTASEGAQPGIEWGNALGVGLVGVGELWLVQGLGWGLPGPPLLAGMLAASGFGLVWWHADHASGKDIEASRGRWRFLAPMMAHWTVVAGLLLGVAFVIAAIVLVVATLTTGDAVRTFVAIGLSVVALALLAAPWVQRMRQALSVARDAQVMADARADVAAHLHDSVLQTLALIQRQAGDPRAVVRLARRQERELRAWLYGDEVPDETLKAALAGAAQEIEDTFPVSVECVVVGDVELDARLGELVKAAREAMLNAAKHSGADVIDVYAEVMGATIEVFVRDRGRGFDPDHVPADRLGVRGSITERMARHQGRATIRSTPDRGTEVTLEMTT